MRTIRQRRSTVSAWTHWSGPDFGLADGHLRHLVSVYGPRGAFAASIAWYRAGAGTGQALPANEI